ncbi:MAG: ATP-binding protein [Anaerolineae bacterium]
MDYDQREDLRKPLLAMLERLTDLIEVRNTLKTVQVGLFRLEIRDFPQEVYREAILNALVHRDYTVPGGIYIRHRSDRLIIESPGGFPAGITPHNILYYRPYHRNAVLTDLLEQLRFVERAGVGVERWTTGYTNLPTFASGL